MKKTLLPLSTLFYSPLTLAGLFVTDDPQKVLQSERNEREDVMLCDDAALMRCAPARELQSGDLILSPSKGWKLSDQGYSPVSWRNALVTLERVDGHETQTLRYLVALPEDTDLADWLKAFDKTQQEELLILTSAVCPTYVEGTLTLSGEWESQHPAQHWADLPAEPLTVAEFKRQLVVGRQLECVCREVQTADPASRILNAADTRYVVHKIQTESACFLDANGNPRWLSYPKRNSGRRLLQIPGGFIVENEQKPGLTRQIYQWLDAAAS